MTAAALHHTKVNTSLTWLVDGQLGFDAEKSREHRSVSFELDELSKLSLSFIFVAC